MKTDVLRFFHAHSFPLDKKKNNKKLNYKKEENGLPFMHISWKSLLIFHLWCTFLTYLYWYFQSQEIPDGHRAPVPESSARGSGTRSVDTQTPGSPGSRDSSSGSRSQSVSPAYPIIPGAMDSSRPSSGTDSGGIERLEKGGSNGQWNRLEWNWEAIYLYIIRNACEVFVAWD